MYEMNTSNKRKEVNFMSEKKAKRLLQRNEVPEELTWDLTKVFKSDEEFEKEYQAVKDEVQNFRKLQGTMDQGSQRFLQIIENFLYFFKSIAFNTIPKIAIAHIIPNIVQPVAVSYSLKVHNANGVYEPAINKNIVQWSNTCITFFPVQRGLRP